MNDERILALLKLDLQISVSAYDALLQNFIDLAKEAITIEGITLDPTSPADDALIESYAAWLARKRKENVSMPRMLSWQLNNRLFSEKVNQED